MKTLHAKGALIISLTLAGVTSVIFILLSAYEFWEGDVGFGILFLSLKRKENDRI